MTKYEEKLRSMLEEQYFTTTKDRFKNLKNGDVLKLMDIDWLIKNKHKVRCSFCTGMEYSIEDTIIFDIDIWYYGGYTCINKWNFSLDMFQYATEKLPYSVDLL